MDGLERLINGLDDTVDTSVNKTWYDFFIQNSRANLLVIISGLIPFFFIPVIIMIFNAAASGFAIGGFALVYELSFFRSFLGAIAPHGVLEYAVNLLGFSLGIILCIKMIAGIKNKNIKTTMPYYIINSLRVYVLVILPVLFIAGMIESTITPFVINSIT